jgi:hypothetical protein
MIRVLLIFLKVAEDVNEAIRSAEEMLGLINCLSC